jgi:predicted nucleic acid-binding protein
VSERIFIDTVFIVALVNELDQYHEEAVEWSLQIEGGPLLITDAVLLEVGNHLARRHRAEAVDVIEGLLAADDVQVVHLTPKLFLQALDTYKTYKDKTWSLVDCISFQVMRNYGVIEALTADHHFAQAGFRVLMRELPQ